MGSADVQGQLWGSAPENWAEVMEPFAQPLFAATIAALEPLTDRRVLDAGCGTGMALQLAAAAGAQVTGLDATKPMLDVARERLPQADLRVGDIQELPFDDGTFDVVMAFNAIQYAAEPKAAMAELARVVRPGGKVAIGAWGDPERCQTEVVFQAVRSLAPPAPGAPAPLAISAPGVIEDLVGEAGLSLSTSAAVACPFTYPDLETAWRGHAATGPVSKAVQVAGQDAVMATFFEIHQAYRRSDGSFRQENEFRYVIADKLA